MNLDSRRQLENTERRRIKILADEAVALAKNLDLDRDPSAHISRTLRGIPEGEERDRLFGQIKAELKRRGFKSPQERTREERQMLENARRQILLEDASKHEACIDPRERKDANEEAA